MLAYQIISGIIRLYPMALVNRSFQGTLFDNVTIVHVKQFNLYNTTKTSKREVIVCFSFIHYY